MPHIACYIASYHDDSSVLVPFSAVASARQEGQQTPVDFLTRFCGLSPPMLFARIGTVPVPVKTTSIRIASGPAERLDNG
jgi:hypothetical protein